MLVPTVACPAPACPLLHPAALHPRTRTHSFKAHRSWPSSILLHIFNLIATRIREMIHDFVRLRRGVFFCRPGDAVDSARTQVTLFKRNFHHVVSDAYFRSYKAVTRGNPNYFITYGNGKSAARMQRGLRPNGAHRWFNYFKHPRRAGPCSRDALMDIKRPGCSRTASFDLKSQMLSEPLHARWVSDTSFCVTAQSGFVPLQGGDA